MCGPAPTILLTSVVFICETLRRLSGGFLGDSHDCSAFDPQIASLFLISGGVPKSMKRSSRDSCRTELSATITSRK
jgi:hypothetical protein